MAGCFAAARLALFPIDRQLAAVLIVVENNFLQAVVVEIVVALFAVPRFVAAGTARASAPAASAPFASFLRLARFVTRIFAVDRRFG